MSSSSSSSSGAAAATALGDMTGAGKAKHSLHWAAPVRAAASWQELAGSGSGQLTHAQCAQAAVDVVCPGWLRAAPPCSRQGRCKEGVQTRQSEEGMRSVCGGGPMLPALQSALAAGIPCLKGGGATCLP